jgi:ribose 5-phosphate isomerase RpiB
MCGDFGDQESIDEELFEQFIERTARFGVVARPAGDEAAVALDTEQARAGYLDQLFKAGLTRCVNDAAGLPCGERMDALAGQAIVFARLAGFLAAQFPPEADRFRTVITAAVDAHEEQNGRR